MFKSSYTIVLSMLFESVYQIRGSTGVGPFGNDWLVKIVLVGIAFLFCWYDWKTKHRTDYWSVLAWGSIIWGIAELVLQVTGIRDFAPKYILGWEVPIWLSIPVRGIVEGGLVAVGCLFFADRMLDPKTRKSSVIIYTLLMGVLIAAAFIRVTLEQYPGPTYGSLTVPSRRNIFAPIPVAFCIVMIGVSLFFFFSPRTPPDLRQRGILLFILMVIFGACWTLGEWASGTRWIEVGSPNTYMHAPPAIEFWALTWDVVVEIAFAYVPFFVFPVWKKDIKSVTIRSPNTSMNQ